MILRAATTGDAGDIAALESACFGRDAWSLPMVASELAAAQRQAVAAEEDQAVVGYALTMASGDVVDLLRIAVHPSWRRRGVARDLLRETLARTAGSEADRMLLEVGAGNAAARALYAWAGFREIARRRRYYRDGSDALVLALPLPGRQIDATQ